MNASLRDAIQTIKTLTGQKQTLSVPRSFVESFQEWPMAVFFSQVLYWSGVKGDEDDGWFYKSYQDWSDEIILTERQIRRCSEELQKMGLIKVALRQHGGFPVLHWKVDDEAFTEWFECLPLRSGPSVKKADGFLRKVRIETDVTEESELTKGKNPPCSTKTDTHSQTFLAEENSPTPEGKEGEEPDPCNSAQVVEALIEVVCLDEFSEAFERLDLEDDVITFVTNAYRRENRKAKLENLKSRANERLCEDIRKAELENDAEPFRCALLAFLADGHDAWVIEKKWPIRWFLPRAWKYLPSSPQNGDGAGKAELSEAVDLPPIVLDPLPQPEGSSCVYAFPEPVRLWNEIVTAGEPVDSWTRRDSHLEKAIQDPDFLAALPKVLKNCQAAREGNEEMTRHVNFRWLLKKDKAGVAENWYDVANGTLAWARQKPAGAGGRKSAGALAIEEAMAQLGGPK